MGKFQLGCVFSLTSLEFGSFGKLYIAQVKHIRCVKPVLCTASQNLNDLFVPDNELSFLHVTFIIEAKP